jgi:chemotaxis protein histidine kinase CheA
MLRGAKTQKTKGEHKMNKRKRTASIMVGTMSLLLLLGGCSMEPKATDIEDMQAAAAESETELYQAKIAYYQGQMQLLEMQLSEMDAKILQLQSEYQSETSKMQQELQTLRQNATTDAEETQKPQEDAPQQSAKNEPEGEQQTDQSSSENSPLEQPSQATHAYIYEDTEGGVILTKYIGKENCVEIPAAVDGKRVVALADRIFCDTKVTSVTIPQTVQKLGWFTFYGCSSLRQVSIPASVSNIGYASFEGCHKDLVLHVSENSYAQKYAASFALHYEIS